MQTDIVLAKLDTARTALAEAKTIQETKKILDVAAAAEILAKRQKLGEEAVQYATSIKVEALAQLGRMLQDNPKNTGARGYGKSGVTNQYPTLEELGLDKRTSKLAQDIAALPEDKIEAVKQGVVSISKASKQVRTEENKNKPVKRSIMKTNVKLYNGDMLDVLNTLGGFDLVVADPPYNVTQWDWDKLGSRDDFLKETQNWLEAIRAHLNKEYNMFWFCSPSYAADIEILLRGLGFEIKSRIVWHRRNMANGSDAKYKFVDSWEMIFHVGNRQLNFPLNWDDSRFDVQTFAVPQTNFNDTKYHPTQKPVDLIRWLVSYGSFEGDRVLDPFAGSGTTGATCEGREYHLIECNKNYSKVIEQRFGIEAEDARF